MAVLSGAISCHTCLRYSRVLPEGDGAKLMPGLWPVAGVILQYVKNLSCRADRALQSHQ